MHLLIGLSMLRGARRCALYARPLNLGAADPTMDGIDGLQWVEGTQSGYAKVNER